MKNLIYKSILVFFIFHLYSCSSEYSSNNVSKNEFLQEKTRLVFEKEWYVTELHCDNSSLPSDYADPIFRFDALDGEEHYFREQQIYLINEITGGVSSFIDGNLVGEILMTLFYHNSFGAQQEVQFHVMEITEDRMVIFDDDSALFPSEEFCWITLEAK